MLGRVIKGDASDALSEKPVLPPPRRAQVVNAEEFEAKTTARDIIAKAHEEADRIKSEAIRYKEEVAAKARDEAQADVQARATEELARAKLQAGQIVADSQKDVLELALMCANKILGRDLERQPELVLEIVANCTEAARSAKAMVIKVNPEDGKRIRASMPRLMELIGRSLDISVRDDSDVERGGCIIRTEYGTIDGQIRTQIDMLRNLLTPTEARKEVK